MSTRCMIGFYDSKPGEERPDLKEDHVLVYRHSDGYPEGVLPDLLPVLSKFYRERGEDTEYQAARVLQYMMKRHDEIISKVQPVGVWAWLGYGISLRLHGDIEYYYAVYHDRIDVYETDTKVQYDKFKHLKTIKFDDLDDVADEVFKKFEEVSGK